MRSIFRPRRAWQSGWSPLDKTPQTRVLHTLLGGLPVHDTGLPHVS